MESHCCIEAVLIRTLQHYPKKGNKDQWSKRHCSEARLHKYGKLIFDKNDKSIQ